MDIVNWRWSLSRDYTHQMLIRASIMRRDLGDARAMVRQNIEVLRNISKPKLP